MIPLATFRRDDDPNGAIGRVFWEPRSGAVWLRSAGATTRSSPTLYFGTRRAEVDALVADVWGSRFPKTFRAVRNDL